MLLDVLGNRTYARQGRSASTGTDSRATLEPGTVAPTDGVPLARELYAAAASARAKHGQLRRVGLDGKITCCHDCRWSARKGSRLR